MRTISKVHTPEERTHQRLLGEARADDCRMTLIAATAMTYAFMGLLLPQAGSASWWLAPLCLLPGLVCLLLLWTAMRLCGAATLMEAARTLLGRIGGWIVGGLMAALAVAEGLRAMTALCCLFTEGVGVKLSPLLLGIVTALLLMLSLKARGLPRGAVLLRLPMLLLLAALAVDLAGMARLDHLSPWLGSGAAATEYAGLLNLSAGWPLTLFLMLPPSEGRRRTLRGAGVSLALTCGVVALVCLALPHELLLREGELASALLLPAAFLRPLNRTLALCLWLILLGLTIASTAQLGASWVQSAAQRPRRWIAPLLLAAFALAQAGDQSTLWSALTAIRMWSLVPLAVLAILLPICALIRRGRRSP